MGHLIHIARFAWPYLRPYWPRLLLGILCGIIFGLIHAGFVAATKLIIDRLTGIPALSLAADSWLSQNAPALLRFLDQTFTTTVNTLLPLMGQPLTLTQIIGGALFLPTLVAIRAITGYLGNYSMCWVSERAASDLRCDILAKLNSLSHEFFNKSKSGDLMTRVHGDTQAIESCVGSGFADLIKEPITILSIIAMLLWINPILALVGLLFLPLSILPVARLGKKMRRASQASLDAVISQANLLLESLAGIRTIKAFGLEEIQVAKFRAHQRQVVHHNMKRTQARELVNPSIELASSLGLGLLILFVVASSTQIADIGGFIMGLVLIGNPVKKLARLHVLIKQTSVGVDRLTEIQQLVPSVQDPPQPLPLPSFSRHLQFHHVSFAYDQTLVLRNLDLTIPKGTKLGIAGESGSGKSSLVNLLFRFYDPTSGSITLDDIDLRHLRTAELRQLMALVSQEIVLFDDTVANNIAFGKPNASRDEIIQAARDAGAHLFIEQLPHGYDTLIGERGVLLSGGQRQRLAIARAFIRNAPILVLDEATASLDSHAEQEIQTTIDHLTQSRTVICVAHRLSTLQSMDRIIVLAQGQIVESGTYSQLLHADGPFAQLAAKQGLRPS
ncbi:MAG: ABC transporter ATP-binding protein [Verrucomicrobiia bacterium]